MAADLRSIMEIISEVKNGTINRIVYKSELPINKDAKRLGIKIYSVTDKLIRFGVAYKGEDSSEAAGSKKKTNNFNWILKNKISFNSNTEKYYLRISKLNKHSNTKRNYFIDINGDCMQISEATAKEFLIPSYGKSYGPHTIQNISIENIIQFNRFVL